MAPVNISSFADKQLALLSAELKAELDETSLLTSTHAPSTLARAGLAVVNLDVASQRTGFGGKTLIDLSLDSAVAGADKELPEHGIRVGDIVGVSEQPKGAERRKEKGEMEKKQVQGVVTKVSRETIVVALDKDEVEIPGGKLWMCVLDAWAWMIVRLIISVYVESSSPMMLLTRGILIPVVKCVIDVRDSS